MARQTSLAENGLQKLEGVVTHTIYENRDTGYAVFEVDAGAPVGTAVCGT